MMCYLERKKNTCVQENDTKKCIKEKKLRKRPQTKL